MSMREDLNGLGYEFSKILKKDIERIQEKKKATINLINSETEKKIQKDLIKLEANLIQNAKIQINKTVSDKINEINREILLVKTKLVDDFMEAITNEVTNRINANPDGYYNWLNNQIINLNATFPLKAKLFLNHHDIKAVEGNSQLISLPQDIQLDKSSPLDTLCGYKVISLDNSYCFDFTFETRLDQIRDDLSMRLMKFFPIFEVNIESIMANFEKLTKSSQEAENSNA